MFQRRSLVEWVLLILLCCSLLTLLWLVGMIFVSAFTDLNETTIYPLNGTEFEFQIEGKGIYTYITTTDSTEQKYRINSEYITWKYDVPENESEYAELEYIGFSDPQFMTVHLHPSKIPDS